MLVKIGVPVYRNQGLFILYRGYLFTYFDPKEPSSGYTYTRVTKNSCLFMSGLFITLNVVIPLCFIT